MSTEITKHILQQDNVAKKVAEIMGNEMKSRTFLTSAMSVIQSNELLRKADQPSIYQAVMMAVTLDLPITPSLGYAHIVPFGGKAQFQLGWKGAVQLCWRSGQFKTISSTEIYEGQLAEENPLTGFVFDWKAKTSDKIIGYAGYFELLNGANKTFYMTTEQVEKHAKKFSQTYKKGFGVWKDQFDEMAKKTVLKLLLQKYAPMSIEMQRAFIADQSIVNDYESNDVSHNDNYTDITSLNEDKEKERCVAHILTFTTKAQCDEFETTAIAAECGGELDAHRKTLKA